MGKRFWLGLLIVLMVVFSYLFISVPAEEGVVLPFETFELGAFQGIGLSPTQVDQLWFYYPESAEDPRSIEGLKALFSHSEKTLLFATNGGIFSPHYEPVGLYVEEGQTLFPLNLAEGERNFFLKPNGVFWVDGNQASVQVAEDYDDSKTPEFALQSGPMLVVNGEFHPAFNPDSENKFIRSGVGVTEWGGVFFAISKEPVTFYDFASFFRDELGTPNALYLDGAISEMFIEGVQEAGFSQDFSVMVGIWDF